MTTVRSVPSLRARAAVALCAVILTALACEALARWFFPAPPDGSREPQVAYAYDPEIRYVPAPSQQGWIDDGLVTINSRRFRGREVDVPKPERRLRIVVIGDSLTLGWGVNDDETYAAQLERLLRVRLGGRDVDVVNLGVGGYNTRQSVTWLARNVIQLKPDIVVVGFYSNDVPDALEGDASNTRIAASRPSGGQVLRINPTASDWFSRMVRKSRAAYLAGRAFNRFRGAGEWGMSRFALEIDMLEGDSPPELEEAWTLVGTQFARLKTLAATEGFSVAVVVLPCREQVMGEYPSASFQKRVRGMVEPLGFQVVDPLSRLAGSRDRIRDLYIPYDRNHPAAAGHRLIAEAIADAFVERGVIPPAAPR